MIIGESVDSALGALGGKPESESDASDSIGGIAASIAIGGNRSERGNPGAAAGDPRTPEAQRMGLLRKPGSFSSGDSLFILLSSSASLQRPARVQLHPGGHCCPNQTASSARLDPNALPWTEWVVQNRGQYGRTLLVPAASPGRQCGHCDWHQTSSRPRHGSFSNYRKTVGIGYYCHLHHGTWTVSSWSIQAGPVCRFCWNQNA